MKQYEADNASYLGPHPRKNNNVLGRSEPRDDQAPFDGGRKLLLVMALQADGRSVEGDPILAVDTLGAARETVMITSDGIGAREMLHSENSPVRWTVLGIVDQS